MYSFKGQFNPRGGGGLEKFWAGCLGLLFWVWNFAKIYFFGWKKIKIIFWVGTFWNYFLGSLKVTTFIFFWGGGGRSRYPLGYFFVHNLFKKKDGSTRYTHMKLDRGRGTSIIPSMAVEKKCIQQIRCAIWLTFWLSDNIFVKFWEVYISSSYWNPYQNELCSISRWPVPLLTWKWIFRQSG